MSNFNNLEHLNSLRVSKENFEFLKAEYVSDELLFEPQYVNYRVNQKGMRFYARVLTDGKKTAVKYAPSQSSLLSATIPADPMLLAWGRRLGEDKFKIFMQASANYGTFLHVMFGRFLRGEKFLLFEESLLDEAVNFFEENGYKFEQFFDWYKTERRNIRKDMLGFACWVKDFNVRPLAIEYPVFAEDSTIAQTLDLVCRMKIDGEEIIALVDYKTGMNSFYYKDAFQLLSGAQLWNEEFVDEFKVTRWFNYGCSNYRLKTLYKKLQGGKTGAFKPYRWQEQTDKADPELLLQYIRTFHLIPDIMNISKIIDFDPMLTIGIDEDLSGALIEIDTTEHLIQEVSNEQNTEESF